MNFDETAALANFDKIQNVLNDFDKFAECQPVYDKEPIYPEIAIPREDLSLADAQYNIIVEQIKDFEASLDSEHEVALKLAYFGQSIMMSVTDIGYQNPSLIFYYGYVNDAPCRLIQHVSQINFLLLSQQKTDPEKPARRVNIGFHAPKE